MPLARLQSFRGKRAVFAPLLRPVQQPWALRAPIIVLLACAYTGLMVYFSYRYGRLALYPNYDDVGYMDDALRRLETLYNSGVAEAIREYIRNPPHAPFSAFLASTAFAIFGAHDWAPYVADVLLIICYFGFADYLLKGVAIWQKLLVYLLMASFPLLSWAVVEFRPDHASALFLTIGVVMILSRPWVNSSRRHQVIAGVWCGLAIWSKPQTVVGALLMVGAALVLASLCDRLGERLRPSFAQIAKSWLACLVPVVLIPLPHFLVGGADIYHYIYDNLFGRDRGVWQKHASLILQAFYYLTGEGGRSMFGGRINPESLAPEPWVPIHLQIVVLILVIATIRLLWRGRRREIVRGAALILLLLGSFLIPTAIRTKSPFFGVGFGTLLLFVTVLAVRDLLLAERMGRPRATRRIPMFSAGLIAVCAVGAAAWGWPLHMGDRSADWMRNRRDIVYGIYDDIRDNRDFLNPMVFVPVAGDINYAVIDYLALKDGRQMIPYGSNVRTSDPAWAKRQLESADFVVLGEKGTGLLADFLPEYGMLDDLVQTLDARDDYALIGRYTFRKAGRSLFLYEHVRRFFGWRPVSGFGDLEANNDPNAPEVRWGYGPKSALAFEAPIDGQYRLSWKGRSVFHGQAMTFKLDGQPLTAIRFDGPSADGQIAFDVQRGPHTIEIEYAQWERVMPRPMAVLFAGLRVTPVRK